MHIFFSACRSMTHMSNVIDLSWFISNSSGVRGRSWTWLQENTTRNADYYWWYNQVEWLMIVSYLVGLPVEFWMIANDLVFLVATQWTMVKPTIVTNGFVGSWWLPSCPDNMAPLVAGSAQAVQEHVQSKLDEAAAAAGSRVMAWLMRRYPGWFNATVVGTQAVLVDFQPRVFKTEPSLGFVVLKCFKHLKNNPLVVINGWNHQPDQGWLYPRLVAVNGNSQHQIPWQFPLAFRYIPCLHQPFLGPRDAFLSLRLSICSSISWSNLIYPSTPSIWNLSIFLSNLSIQPRLS